MIPALTELTNLIAGQMWAALAVFLRVGAAMASLPAFGEHAVPARVRLVLALAFTTIVYPAVTQRLPGGDPPALAYLGEVLIGLGLGIVLRVFVMVLQVAGAMAAQSSSLAALFGGAGPEPQSAMSQLLLMAGLALAVSAGLHVKLAAMLIGSYDALPFGRLPDAADFAAWGVRLVSQGFALAFTLAAPFIFAALVYNVALGVINRAMPQLMVAFVGAPALTLGSLVMMAIVAPLMLDVWRAAFEAVLADPTGVAP